MSVSTAIDQRADHAPTKREALRHLVGANADAIGMSLPTGYSRDRFVRLLLTAANTNPELFDCDPRSFLAAGVACAQLGLEPNDARGLAYLIPFKDRQRGRVVVPVIGYRGMLDLVRRSGMVGAVFGHAVYTGDEFDYQLGLDPKLRHVPCGEDDPAKVTHAYAVARVNGEPQFVVLTRRQLDKVKAQYGRSSQSPWNGEYFPEMCVKTAIRRLCKFLPMSADVATGIERDEQIVDLADMAMPLSVDPAVDDITDADVIDVVDQADDDTTEEGAK